MRNIAAVLLVAAALPLFATDPNPSVRQRELTLRLLELSHTERTAHAAMDAMLGETEKRLVGLAESTGDEQRVTEARELFEAFRAKAAKLDFTALMQEAYVRIYAKYFSEKELEDLIAFYTTPTGKKSIELMPDLMREGMEAAALELTPKIEQISAEVMAEQEKKRPWRRTMKDLQSVSAAIEAYAADNDELYPQGDYESLKALLEPDFIDDFPEKDIWGHAYAYVVSPDRRQFRLVSAGADSIFDWDSRRIVPVTDEEDRPVRYRDRLEDDVVLDDWGFVQLPVQAKKEHEN